MKILVLHGTSDLYGSGKILLTAVEALIQQGHSVIVLLSEEGPLSAEMRKAGAVVSIVRLGILRKKYFTVGGIFNRVKVLYSAFRTIKKMIAVEKIDLIYSNTTTVLIGAVVAKAYPLKHIWHIHEMIVKPRFMYHLNGFFLQHLGQRIIAVSNPVKQHWLKWVDENKIKVIHNGIETAPFENTSGQLRNELGLSDDTILIGMIGRVNIFKGQEYFLEIASILKNSYPNAKFILVGDAYRGYEYLYDKIDMIIEKNDLSKTVFDLRYREDIPNILRSFNILVLPSQLPDSFPTVILEAMACGVTVVATKQGGAVEMIDDQITGYLIPLQDAREASRQISKLIDNEHLRKELGQKGKEKLHKAYSLDAFKKNIVTFVEKG